MFHELIMFWKQAWKGFVWSSKVIAHVIIWALVMAVGLAVSGAAKYLMLKPTPIEKNDDKNTIYPEVGDVNTTNNSVINNIINVTNNSFNNVDLSTLKQWIIAIIEEIEKTRNESQFLSAKMSRLTSFRAKEESESEKKQREQKLQAGYEK